MNWETEITTEGQGYLVELAADGNTAPKATMTRSSIFRYKCGDDHLMSHTNRVRETYTVHARRCPVSPLETTSPACYRFSFREMLNSRRFDDFSEHVQIVLVTLRDPELNADYNATADG